MADHFDQQAFRRATALMERRFLAGIAPAMDEASNRLADHIRREAPVATGRLRASVAVGPARRRRGRIAQDVTIAGGHDEPFVGHVEYGTAHEPPDGFIRRSADAEEAAMIRIIEDAVARAID